MERDKDVCSMPLFLSIGDIVKKINFSWGAVGMCAVLSIILIGFALQTFQLVSELFPNDQLAMKLFAVGALDGSGILFLVLDMFWPFKYRNHKTLAGGMTWICFGGSSLATFIQVLFFDAIHVNASLPSLALVAIYFVIAGLTVADVWVLVIIIHGQYASVNTFSDVSLEEAVQVSLLSEKKTR